MCIKKRQYYYIVLMGTKKPYERAFVVCTVAERCRMDLVGGRRGLIPADPVLRLPGRP
jgi:hypothetical protein